MKKENEFKVWLSDIADLLYKEIDYCDGELDKNRLNIKNVDMFQVEKLMNEFMNERKKLEKVELGDYDYMSGIAILFFLLVNEQYELFDRLNDFLLGKKESILNVELIETLYNCRKTKNRKEKIKCLIKKMNEDNLRIEEYLGHPFHIVYYYYKRHYEDNLNEIINEAEIEFFRTIKLEKIKRIISSKYQVKVI